MGKTIIGAFATRREVELAGEHLVQEYGLERTDIFIEPESDQNSSGVSPSGGDAKSGHPASAPNDDAALNSALLVSVDINENELGDVQKAFREIGAKSIVVRSAPADDCRDPLAEALQAWRSRAASRNSAVTR